MCRKQIDRSCSLTRVFAFLFALIFAAGAGIAQAQTAADPENTLVLELKTGEVLIALRPDIAPKHVERVKRLAREGFYDGLKFHRVIEGFMAQTGDPRGDGTGGSNYPDLPAEFSNVPFERGVVGAARTADPNSANSQFFIMFASAPHLNGQYTVWGRVIEGMEHVDRIKKGDPRTGRVTNPDTIVRMYVLADKKK
ncbi:MAG: peptidylprolyl isomerase [Proteobacteria bacterium]|jgi:peptidylprolyl isomerase|nr:MAG: peptidylprolyl isomerase [Pseudomonadota bacterium]